MKKKSLSIVISSVIAFSLVFSLLSSDTYALEDTASAEFISEDDESDELFTDENHKEESAEVSEEESADTSEKDSEKASEEDSAVPSDADNEFFADPEDATESDGENDPRIPVYDDSFGILLPPEEVPAEDEYILAEEPEDDLMAAIGKANVTHYTVSMAPQKSTNRNITGIYFSDTPAIVTFFDPAGNLNVAYPSAAKKVTVQVYSLPSMTLSATKTLSMTLSLFGGITCDSDGNYYVTSGQTGEMDAVTMCITKYNSDGAYQAELALKGRDTIPPNTMRDTDFGTKIPFNAGNCSMCTGGGVVAVNYAREMFSGHQSNMIIYAYCDTMERIYADTAYTSHSFDQRIYPYEDGFIALNHGDAYYRGFHFTKINEFFDDDPYWSDPADGFYNFHFREGANRGFGYNETFAQLGGLAAIDNSYVFAGSSERTLSLSPGPTSGYCGHNEPRDLFIQMIRKDSESYGNKNNTHDKYIVEGSTRTPTGTRPASSQTELYLDGTEKDYGIIWLTNYSGNTYAANPKVFAISGSTFGVMWEKRTYGSASGETFFMMLDEYGNVIKEAMKVEGCLLAADTDPAVKDGLVYWATSDSYGKKIHVLDPSGIAITKQPYIISAEENGDHTKKVVIGLEAEGAETYEWQSSADGENWTAVSSSDASGYDTAELTIEKLPDGIRFYRCQMTDTDAKVAVSDAAFGFLDNAETVYAESGANATLSVDVLGGKQYCWKYSTNGSTWNDLNDADIIGASSRTVTIPMNDARFGYKYKCTVTELSGNTEDSSAVNIRRKLMITKQPEDIRGAMGSTYNASLTAFGDGLKYTWYMLDSDTGNRISITYKGYQTSTLSIKLDTSTAYRSFVCVVKDKYGNELTSDKMTIRENITVSVTPKKLTLVSRPGSTAVLTVSQTGRFYPDDSFVWHSSAESVATVENGTVTAKDGLTEPGTATITVTTNDGKYSDSCIVTVNPVPAAEMPKASLASGRYPYGSKVTLTSATANAKIIYTTDNSDPAVDAAGSPLGTTVLYSSPITLTADISLKAATVKDGYKNSRTSTYNYTVEAGWGDVNGLIRNKFTAPEDVPDGIWFIFGNENDGYSDVYTKSADTDFSKTYTGSAITFDTEIHVFHGNGRLWQNRDYTLTYSANTSVPSAAAKPRVTVTGKGNYTGKSIFSFRIGPADLSDADITSEKSIGAAAGSKLGAIKPSLSFNGKKLSANKDYVLEYYRDAVAPANLIADPAKETLENGKTYYIKMNAKGGSCFTGTADTVTVRAINEKDNVSVAMSKVKITVPKVPYSPAGIKVQKLFDGSEMVKATVSYKNTSLRYGTDFTVDDITLTDSGKYTIAVHGTADTGNPYSFYGNKTATVEVTGIPAAKVKIACMATSCDYRGRRIVLNDFYKADNTGYTEVTLYTQDGAVRTALSEGDDYSVSLSNSGSTGSVNVVFTLKGVYSGTIKKAVRINAYNIAKDPLNLIGITVDDAAFVKSGAAPAVTVTFDGAALKEGEDYSVSYKNNTKLGNKTDKNAPAATVKGMGNFTGSVSVPFSITKSDASGIEIECADVPYKNKAGAFKSKVKITEGGTALSIGKNKDIESADISYYYADTGEELDDSVTVPADTAIEVRAKVTCSSSSPYIAGPYVIKGFYRVISADKDISRASISIDASDLKYDRGRYVLPEKKKGMVKLGTYVLEESEFEIVSVTSNRFLGTATVKIRGTGSYGGTKTATFRIGAKPMN